MKRPKIIEGNPFDWQKGAEAFENSIYPDGEVNWRAAMSADLGILSCPFCDERMWHEGNVVECVTCEQQFNTNWREIARKATGKDPVVFRIQNETNAKIVAILEEAYDVVDQGEYILKHSAAPLLRKFAHASQELKIRLR